MRRCTAFLRGRWPVAQDAAGHHNSALFVGPVPYQPAGSSWDEQLDGYVAHLLSICDRFAPGAPQDIVNVNY